MQINDRPIGPNHPPYIIAELSANHNGDIQTAFRIMEAAKDAGADAIKIQTYRPDTITIDHHGPEFMIKGGLWDGKRLYDLYDWAHTPWDWHEALFRKARALDVTLFSSPFDHSAVDLLEGLNAPAYKIASFELVDLPLIRRVAQTGKPMIMSTGMANDVEIAEALACAHDAGAQDVVLLHCVSGYPAPASDYNLATLPDMATRFGVMTGLSDHTLDNTAAVTSVGLGAVMIEKHVTLDRDGGGPDDSFSLEPPELAQLVQGARTAWQARGQVDYGLKSSEQGNAQFRRSLYVVEDIPAGGTLTPQNIRSIRPGFGLAPKHYDKVLGMRATSALPRGTALSWDALDGSD
ncbi:MAG: pseudaminic acid synthase [Pseudomonadota bacterium]